MSWGTHTGNVWAGARGVGPQAQKGRVRVQCVAAQAGGKNEMFFWTGTKGLWTGMKVRRVQGWVQKVGGGLGGERLKGQSGRLPLPGCRGPGRGAVRHVGMCR